MAHPGNVSPQHHCSFPEQLRAWALPCGAAAPGLTIAAFRALVGLQQRREGPCSAGAKALGAKGAAAHWFGGKWHSLGIPLATCSYPSKCKASFHSSISTLSLNFIQVWDLPIGEPAHRMHQLKWFYHSWEGGRIYPEVALGLTDHRHEACPVGTVSSSCSLTNPVNYSLFMQPPLISALDDSEVSAFLLQ